MNMGKLWGGQSMVAALKSVLLCPPASARWGSSERIMQWKELGYFHNPQLHNAEKEHRRLRQALESTGCEIHILEDCREFTLDAAYVHDASFITDHGAVCLRMGKPARAGEPAAHGTFYEARGIPVIGMMDGPCTAEAGDIVWLDPTTLLVGRGFRTNSAGAEWLRDSLSPYGITVLCAPLPYGPGPSSCLHLMSLMSMLDEETALVDLPMLAVETAELLRSRGIRFVEIDGSERVTLAANVLALGPGQLLALEQNPLTNAKLKRAGFEVLTFPGAEIGINGGGGPTCLTRPLLRI